MIVDWLEKQQFSCAVKSTFGVNCPGCGTQRSIIALLKGNIIESIQLHPGVLLFLITLFITILHLFLKFKNGAWLILCTFSLTVAATLFHYILHFFS